MTHLTQQPAIAIPTMDYDRLRNVADGAVKSAPEVAEFLMRELDRAAIAAPDQDMPFVRMGSRVQFRDDTAGRVQDIQLVYPAQADPGAGRISVLTPVGAALIGLSVGQTMQWQDRRGEMKTLTILAVQNGADDIARR